MTHLPYNVVLSIIILFKLRYIERDPISQPSTPLNQSLLCPSPNKPAVFIQLNPGSDKLR